MCVVEYLQQAINFKKYLYVTILSKLYFKISGRIMWSRQLFSHLQMSMEKLSECKELMKTVDGKRIIKNYNRIAAALTEYEVCVFLLLH